MPPEQDENQVGESAGQVRVNRALVDRRDEQGHRLVQQGHVVGFGGEKRQDVADVGQRSRLDRGIGRDLEQGLPSQRRGLPEDGWPAGVLEQQAQRACEVVAV